LQENEQKLFRASVYLEYFL